MVHLDLDEALFKEDTRKNYGEIRYLAHLKKDDILYIVCFTMRERSFRVISYRKASKKERRWYNEEAN